MSDRIRFDEANHDSGWGEGLWQKRCQSLVKLCEAGLWASSLEAVYQHAIDVLSEILACDKADMHLFTVDATRYVKCFSNEEDPRDYQYETRSSTTGRLPWMMETRKPIIMDVDHPHEEDEFPPHMTQSTMRWAITIPLVANNKVLGSCTARYNQPVEWREEEDEAYALSIGKVLGVMVSRVQASQKSADLQVLDDRRRLSNEITNNVSQLVSALVVNADAALLSFEESDQEGLELNLRRLSATSRETMQVIRDEVTSLRAPIYETTAFAETVKEMLGEFEKNWGLQTEFVVKPEDDAFVISMHAASQLTRIINECLSNTLKHADATIVRIVLERGPRYISTSVKDDGKGFDARHIPPECMGIKIMKERAAEAGGALSVTSGDEGTTVCVEIPQFR